MVMAGIEGCHGGDTVTSLHAASQHSLSVSLCKYCCVRKMPAKHTTMAILAMAGIVLVLENLCLQLFISIFSLFWCALDFKYGHGI